MFVVSVYERLVRVMCVTTRTRAGAERRELLGRERHGRGRHGRGVGWDGAERAAHDGTTADSKRRTRVVDVLEVGAG
jgi:hypothetical protein